MSTFVEVPKLLLESVYGRRSSLAYMAVYIRLKELEGRAVNHSVLAESLGMSVASFRQHLRELINRGWIVVLKRYPASAVSYKVFNSPENPVLRS